MLPDIKIRIAIFIDDSITGYDVLRISHQSKENENIIIGSLVSGAGVNKFHKGELAATDLPITATTPRYAGSVFTTYESFKELIHELTKDEFHPAT